MEDEIPTIESQLEATQLTPEEEHQEQRKKCLEAIKKINKDNGSVSVFFNNQVSELLLAELESKGYVIKYTLDYDGRKKEGDKYMCKLRISNPKFQDNANTFIENFEDNLKKIGFNQSSIDTEENIKKMLNGFISF